MEDARLSLGMTYQCNTNRQNLKGGLFPFFVSLGPMTNGSNDSNDDSSSVDDDGYSKLRAFRAENKVQKKERSNFRVLCNMRTFG